MPKTKQTSKPSAPAAYAASMTAAFAALDEIRAAMLSERLPDAKEAHWGHAGDAQHLASQLEAIADRLLGRGEYAPEVSR